MRLKSVDWQRSTDQRNLIKIQGLPELTIEHSPNPVGDLVGLFLIPILSLVLIFHFTDPATLEYRIVDPTLVGILGSNISHRTWNHLTNNILGLVVVGGIAYTLLTAAEYRYHYIMMFIGSLLIIPFFSHFFLQYFLVHQPIFHSYEAVGFSEPLAAMIGYLPLVLTTYLNRASGIRWPILWAILIYSGGIAYAIVQLFGVGFSTIPIAILSIVGILGIGVHVLQLDDGVEKLQYSVTIAFIVMVYIISVVGLFGGPNVGTKVGHLAGFLPGFFAPTLVLWGFSLLKPEHAQSIVLD